MAHRVFRLSITPERAPEVRRVVDFDGRATLHDVHNVIQRELELDNDHLYAFYLSGRYFDRRTAHGIGEHDRHNSERSLLFRLGLSAGQQIAYLFDFGDELRHTVTVVSITDVDAPLAAPVLVESVGNAPLQYGEMEDEREPYELPEYLAEVAPLAEAVLALSEKLDELLEEDDAKYAALDELDDDELDDDELEGDDQSGPPEAIRLQAIELAKAALALAAALEEDDQALHELDEWSQERELLPRLLEVPQLLINVEELDSALAVAKAFVFIAPESCNGDIAVVFAERGKRDEALALVETNLKQFPESFVAVTKSGEAFETLGDFAAAEAAYRKATELAANSDESDEARIRLLALLEELGRPEDLDDDSSDHVGFATDGAINREPAVAAVGRNDPCPCGSGKKYKKCHGA